MMMVMMTMMRLHKLLVLLFLSMTLLQTCCCCCCDSTAAAFVLPTTSRYQKNSLADWQSAKKSYDYCGVFILPQQQPQPQRRSMTTTTTTTTLFSANKNPNRPNSGYDTGEKTGYYMLAVALGVSIWLFTIPPEFRRANICSPEYEGCISLEQWVQDVGDYYRNGGGIQWDFSIDPRTLEKNQQFLEAIRKNAGI